MDKNITPGRNIFINLSLLVISLVVSLLFCEYIIRIIMPQNLSGSWLIYTNNGLSVNKSSGAARHQYGSRVVRYRFYHPHLRGTPLQQNGIKILAVGDSFTFGWLLDEKDTFVNHLQEYSNQEFGDEEFYFLNAGTGGWGTADYAAFIEDFGEVIKPDIVLVFINTDDIGRSIRSKIFTLTSAANYDLSRHGLKSNYFKKFVNLIPGYQWILEHSQSVQLLRNQYVNFFINNDSKLEKMRPGSSSSQLEVSQYAIRLGRAIFMRLKKWCDDHGVDLYITTTGWHQLSGPDSAIEPTKLFISEAEEFFKSINLPFYDISPHMIRIEKESGSDYLLPEGHPDEQANRLIAENVWKYFLKQLLARYDQKIPGQL